MKRQQTIQIDEYTKVLMPTTMHNIQHDHRILIPYIRGGKIGFIDKNGYIISEPKYSMYLGECYNQDDFIVVSTIQTNVYPKTGGKYSISNRTLYGLINYLGEILLETEYYSIWHAIGNKNLFTVENKDCKHGVITADGNIIVPYGKYDWIGQFDKGFARVKIGKESNGIRNSGNKWGLINETGEEILPVVYDDIWPFNNKNQLRSTKVIKGRHESRFFFDTGRLVNNMARQPFDNRYGKNYGEYAESYAQDIMGYSDDVINDAFDGEPDAYWNID